jgi:hypothetical protein
MTDEYFVYEGSILENPEWKKCVDMYCWSDKPMTKVQFEEWMAEYDKLLPMTHTEHYAFFEALRVAGKEWHQ